MRLWVRILAGSVGPALAVVKGGVLYGQQRHPMTFEQWALLAIVVASTTYGLVELILFLRRIHRDVIRLSSDVQELQRGRSAHDKRISALERWHDEAGDDVTSFAKRVLGMVEPTTKTPPTP